MIGIGVWQCSVDTMFYSGDAEIRIFDKGGEYGFELKVPGVDIPQIDVKDVTEDGNHLEATASTDMLPGKEVQISIDFEEDTFSGFLKVPFIGKVKIKDGKKIG